MTAAPVEECPDCRPSAVAGAVVVRPLEPYEGDLVLQVFAGMGRRSRERRFLAPKPRLTASDLRQLTAIDHVHHEALVALSVAEGRPVGVARFVRLEDAPQTADVAVSVVDAWQGQGVGTLLATSLATRAREAGITRFEAVMLPDNEAAARLMHRVADDVERVALDHHGAEFLISLSPSATPPPRRLLKGA